MQNDIYLMECDDEVVRLELKTAKEAVLKQAMWAGIKPGMHVLDVGCGAGKTTAILNELVQPGGSIVGVDRSEGRIEHARNNHQKEGVSFVCRDVLGPLDELGKFDFIWVRFFLEYYRSEAFEIVKNLTKLLNPGGIVCLIDLDHNSMSHYGLDEKLERAFLTAIGVLQEIADFDPYVGRKLYSFLYDLGYLDIKVEVASHHVVYGDCDEVDLFNWGKKLEMAAKRIGYNFEGYENRYDQLLEDFKMYFQDPRRFAYSPLVMCSGRRAF